MSPPRDDVGATALRPHNEPASELVARDAVEGVEAEHRLLLVSYLTERIFTVDWQKSIPAQIHQLILH